MHRFRIPFLLGLAVVLLILWAWGYTYYSVVGLDPNLARPWTIPMAIWNFWDESYFRLRIWLTGAPFLIAGLILGLLMLRGRVKNDLGDARFADETSVRRAGLRAKTGVVLGKLRGQLLMDDGQTHILVAAPTGSGKGVGVVIPNLLNWNGSAVVLDIKGENHALTSGFRQKHGQKIFVFSPFSPNSHCFNPFDAINLSPATRFNNIQGIANTLLPDNEKDPTWSQQGRSLFTAFALYLLDAPEQTCSIGNILRHLQTEVDTRDIVKAILARTDIELDPTAHRAFANFAQQEKRMSESVKVGLVGALAIWNSASVDTATSSTDFDVTRLRARRTTIYVVVSLADLEALKPLLRVFFEQVFAAQLRREPQAGEQHKILFLLDEFESLGTMNGIVDKLPFVRSFGVRMMAIIQGLSQLDQRYTAAGRDKILQGCRHQIFFASNDGQTTNYVSDTLGKKTITTVSKSRHGMSRSVSRQSQARELMLPQEVRELPADKMILITEGTPPVLANKIRYFKDKAMVARTKHAPSQVPALDTEAPKPLRLTDIPGSEALAAQSEVSGQIGSIGQAATPNGAAPQSLPIGRIARPTDAPASRDFDALLEKINSDESRKA